MQKVINISGKEWKAEEYAVFLAKSMLAGELSFWEGSIKMAPLRWCIDDVEEFDDDFLAFVLISSETEQLPAPAQRPLWNQEVIKELEAKLIATEKWAVSIATQACENIIKRFDIDPSKE